MIIELLAVSAIGYLVNGAAGAAWAIIGYFVYCILVAVFFWED